ncbi:MAG TPA: hypothetical protein DCG50_04190 [Elusimicrobia bacterium]|nr:hypothetical protein [Elusimicrobiota bacterium]
MAKTSMFMLRLDNSTVGRFCRKRMYNLLMMTEIVPRLIVLSVLLTGVACSNNNQETTPAAESPAYTATQAGGQTAGQPDLTSGNKEMGRNMTEVQSAAIPGLNMQLAEMTAPAVFEAKFKTTKGDFTVEVTRAWAPRGADRFYSLFKINYFRDIAFFCVIPGSVVQFGIHGDPMINERWSRAAIADDDKSHSNLKGYLAFAVTGPNTRNTRLVIHLADNPRFDSKGYVPIGKVTQGLKVLENLYSGYGDCAPAGKGPEPAKALKGGNAYFKSSFPKLDYIVSTINE